MKRLALAATAVFAFLIAPAVTQAANISFANALTIAQKGTNGMTLLYGRAERSKTIWGFYFLTEDGRIIEKEIHGMTGRILVSKEIEEVKDKGKVDPDIVKALKVRTLTKLSTSRYLEIAVGRNGGEADGFSLSFNNGNLQVIVTGGEGMGWRQSIDAGTGRPLQ